VKAWTDKECRAHKKKVGEDFKDRGIDGLAQFENALIRAAVDEARREQLTAINWWLVNKFVRETAYYLLKDHPQRGDIMLSLEQALASAAILARDKEPCDAER